MKWALRTVGIIVIVPAILIGHMVLVQDQFYWKLGYALFQVNWFGSESSTVLSNKHAYYFDMQTFHATNNSGLSWTTWKLPGFGGGDTSFFFIHSVKINADGTGELFANENGEELRSTYYRTNDFGITWNLDKN
jgi:hypothetical protein